MIKKNRAEETLRNLRKVNMKVDTFLNKVNANIAKSDKEISERKKKAKQ